MELVIAEKPSVARDIARVLGANSRGEGRLQGARHVVTWCIGHLVELEEPGAYNEAWKRWRLDALPMVPDAFKLRPSSGSTAQWKVVRELLRSREFSAVINACDAGREGELIFRYCYELAGSRLPIKRLWISSMTDAALQAGLSSIRPGAQYDALADAARCRAEADWLVGMNATRAVTTRARSGAGNVLFSIGRVQTPTLSLVVERERAIRRFVPRDYWEVLGQFSTPEGTFVATYAHLNQRRLGSLTAARELLARLESHLGKPTGPRIESLEKKTERQPPPLLFDLTSLQRTANKRFGLSAQRTLEITQALYETHKIVTYPRTDSRHLSTDLRNELPNIFQALTGSPDHAAFARTLLASPPGPTPRVFNNGRVTDHHAIIPTSKAPPARLDRDEQRIYDMIARRFLGAFFPDAEFALTTLVVLVGPTAPPPPMPDPVPPRDAILEALPPPPDRLHARGKVLLKAGWREVAGLDDDDTSDRPGDKGADDEPSQRLPPVHQGQTLSGRFESAQKKTRPPPRYTEAALLSAMEFAGREIEDEALRHALKERGLGTPATRASIIETLIKRGYVERQQKNVVPTQLGDALIDSLPTASLASAELTGEWEARLVRMARGDEQRDVFMRDIVGYVRTVVDQVRASTPSTSLPAAGPSAGPPVGPCPLCRGNVVEGFKTFACQGCPFKFWKQIAGKTISTKLAAVLLRARRSQVLSGFRSKAGKPFQAALEIDNTGQIRLSFSSNPRPTDPARAAEPAPDDDGSGAPDAWSDDEPAPASARPPAAPSWGQREATPARPAARRRGESAGAAKKAAPRGKKRAASLDTLAAVLVPARPPEPPLPPPPRPEPPLPPPPRPEPPARLAPASYPEDPYNAPPPSPGPAPRPAPAPRAPAPVAASRPAASAAPEPSPTPAPAVSADGAGETLMCPHCGQGHIMAGRKAWGCSRWRDGCKLVVPFAVGGKALTPVQLRELITRGRTSRKASWLFDGRATKGRLRLDLGVEPPALAVEE